MLLHATLPKPTLGDTMPDNKRLVREITVKIVIENAKLSSMVIKKLSHALRDNNFSVQCVAEHQNDILFVYDITDANASKVCGVAVDIGTTMVSSILADLITGEVLAKKYAGNGQIQHGADVKTGLLHHAVKAEVSDCTLGSGWTPAQILMLRYMTSGLIAGNFGDFSAYQDKAFVGNIFIKVLKEQ